jgi:hypothetical protein
VASLAEFLHEGQAQQFVDDVLQAIEHKSWREDDRKVKAGVVSKQNKPAPIPSVVDGAYAKSPRSALDPDVKVFQPGSFAPPKGPASSFLGNAPRPANPLAGQPIAPLPPTGPKNASGWGGLGPSRKRRLDNQEDLQNVNNRGERPLKIARGMVEPNGALPATLPAKPPSGPVQMPTSAPVPPMKAPPPFQTLSGFRVNGMVPAVPRSGPGFAPISGPGLVPGQSSTPAPVPHVPTLHAFPMPLGASIPSQPSFPIATSAGMSTAFLQSPSLSLAGAWQQSAGNSKARCPSFDNIGICYLGHLCSYDHSLESDESDETKNGPHHVGFQGQGRSNAFGSNGGLHANRKRASFSVHGPMDDRTNTTLVVEKIPQNFFSEAHVRGYFSQFGHVEKVRMDFYKKLSVVKFEDHASAQRAYNSPKVVFNNGFAEVYWYRPEHATVLQNNVARAGQPSGNDVPVVYGQVDETIDAVEFKKQQAEAQKAFEQKRKKREEADAKAKEIAQKLDATETEAQTLRHKLLEMAKAKGAEAINKNGNNAFKSSLPPLAVEADEHFAERDSNEPETENGNFVQYGTGAFLSRAGGFGGGASRSSVKRLDNRPKRVAIGSTKPHSRKDTAVRQYLMVRLNLFFCFVFGFLHPYPAW